MLNVMASFNPFKSKPPVQQPDRNAFDLSFANNITMKFGKLYPVFCKEVIPGDTWRIRPTFGLRFMPMVFPVQTRMRADLHFFYVRVRNLWKNYKKFFGMTDPDVVPPYLKITPDRYSMLETGSLADYLGVPTTVVYGNSSRQRILTTSGVDYEQLQNDTPATFPPTTSVVQPDVTGYYDLYIDPTKLVGNTDSLFVNWDSPNSSTTQKPYLSLLPTGYFVVGTTPLNGNISKSSQLIVSTSDSTVLSQLRCYIAIFRKLPRVEGEDSFGNYFTFMYACKAPLASSAGTGNVTYAFDYEGTSGVTRYGNAITIAEFFDAVDDSFELYPVLMFTGEFKEKFPLPTDMVFTGLMSSQVGEVPDTLSPFIDYGSGPAQPLSALPFRAYESIYNGFYRNVVVNPFMLDGKPEYDIFCTTQEDGADTTGYKLYSRNWEQDFLTTSVPSPQQGTAPLVGAQQRTSNQRFQLSTTVDGAKTSYYVNTEKVDGEQLLTGITGYDKNAPESSVQALNEAIKFGISINDFRNVNSLQRWLEKNVRRGYRYKDQVLSHFGVELTYEECDMPEYIGGVSQDVNVSTTYQTVETTSNPLGSFAGNASCVGTSEHEIDQYCDEEGFIIGILSVSPIPVYSQLLPKMFTKVNNALDYYKPEFGHIGLQPITYREVCPLQAFNEDIPLDNTFGYQRAWYDYLSSVDEVHGDFRTNLKDFLVDRVFGQAPTLGKDFIEIDSQHVNDVFADMGDNDKIIGQLYYDVTAIRPIPKYGEPKIE